jgi:LysR family nitrogen assimilation transcriptional regulator
MLRNAALDLRSLKYVATAIRLESITKAAAQLHVAQPALSRQIRLLEEDLGVVLLVRHRRGVKATREGQTFLQSAERLLRVAHHLREEMSSRSVEPVGQIRLGFLPSTGALFIGRLVADFMRQHPKVTFLLREALTAELSRALLADELDLAVMSYDAKHPDLYRRPLYEEDVWLAGAPSSWPFGKKPVIVDQLVDMPLVHAAMVGNELAKLAKSRKHKFRSVIEGDVGGTAAYAAVRSGAGFILMPGSSLMDDISRRTLAGAPVRGLHVRRGLFWRADRPLSRADLDFVREIEGAVAGLKSKNRTLIRDIANPK